MSEDKVISMGDFRKTEQELNGERPPPEESTVAYTKVMVVKADEHILAIVEQGVEDDDGNDRGVSGITLDYDELLEVMGQLEECKNKMADILLKGGN